MKKERRNMEEIDRFIGKTFGMSQAENSSEQSVSEFREKGMKTIQEQKQQETGHAIEHATPIRACTAYRACNYSTTHQCQDEKGDTRSIQASVPCSDKAK